MPHIYQESEYLELREFLIRKFTPMYSINDKAHQIDHVIDVCDRALRINADFSLGLDRRHIVISALCHDLFTWSRNNHHYLAKEYITSVREPWNDGFTVEELETMGLAAMQHRASWKGEYSSLLSELIATADRGEPGNIEEKIRRCYLYGVDKLKETPEVAIARVIPHLIEKYCEAGYGNNPPLYYRVYGVQLQKMKQQILALTPESDLIKNLEKLA